MNRSTRPPSRATTFVGVAPDSLEWRVSIVTETIRAGVTAAYISEDMGRIQQEGGRPSLMDLVVFWLWVLGSGVVPEAGDSVTTIPKIASALTGATPASVMQAIDHVEAQGGWLTVCRSEIAVRGEAPSMTITLLGEAPPLWQPPESECGWLAACRNGNAVRGEASCAPAMTIAFLGEATPTLGHPAESE